VRGIFRVKNGGLAMISEFASAEIDSKNRRAEEGEKEVFEKNLDKA